MPPPPLCSVSRGPPYQLCAVGDKVPDDGVGAQVVAGHRAVRGPQHHHLTLDHFHALLGHLDLGPDAWMEGGGGGGKREET